MEVVMKRVKLFALLFVLVLASSSFAIQGNGTPMRGQGQQTMYEQNFQPMARLQVELKLSDAQVAKLEKLRDSQRKSRARIQLKIQKIRLNVKEELLNDKINYDKILQYQKQIIVLRDKLATARINHLKQVEKILSKEQFEKFRMHFMDMGKRVKRGVRSRAHNFRSKRNSRGVGRNIR